MAATAKYDVSDTEPDITPKLLDPVEALFSVKLDGQEAIPDVRRANLIGEILRIILHNVHSFYVEDIGPKLSYLSLAIAEEKKIELEHNSRFLDLLRRTFGPNHPIWKHVAVEKTVVCCVCGGEIPILDAIFAGPGWCHQTSC